MLFTKLMRVVANFLRRPRFADGKLFRSAHLLPGYLKKGFRCLFYLDDILVLAPPKTAKRYALAFQEIMHCFGLTLHATKSDFVPARRRIHLGLEVDTHARCFRVPASKYIGLRTAAWELASYA